MRFTFTMEKEKGPKILFLLIDGLGDVPCEEMQNRTPLQAARLPTFDWLTTKAMTGLMSPVEPGIACGSDTAHLSILGYDPRIYYKGRGAFETIGAGLPMAPGDIAFKCNFAVIQNGIVITRRADRYFEEEGPILCEALDGLEVEVYGMSFKVSVKYATEHRCGVRIRGPSLVEHVSGTDPLKDNLPLLRCVPTIDPNDPRASLTCKVIDAVHLAFTRILEEHPINVARAAQGKHKANVVLFRGCASTPNLPPFSSVHGLKAFMIAPCCIIAGIGESLGMTLVKVPGCTGRADSNFKAKFDAAYRYLFESGDNEDYQFGFVHIKAVDEASHNGEPLEKVRLLERIDEAFKSFITAAQGKKFICVITGDHSTSSAVHHDHTHHPVPFMIYTGNPANADHVQSFDEFSAASGSLGLFNGLSAMPLIKHFIHKEKVGL